MTSEPGTIIYRPEYPVLLRSRCYLGSGYLGSRCYSGPASATLNAAEKAAPATDAHPATIREESSQRELTANCPATPVTTRMKSNLTSTSQSRCVTRHADQAEDYDSGVHGHTARPAMKAPRLRIVPWQRATVQSPKSQVFRMAIPDTCGMCHSEVVEQYRASVQQTQAAGITQPRYAPIATGNTRS